MFMISALFVNCGLQLKMERLNVLAFFTNLCHSLLDNFTEMTQSSTKLPRD